MSDELPDLSTILSQGCTATDSDAPRLDAEVPQQATFASSPREGAQAAGTAGEESDNEGDLHDLKMAVRLGYPLVWADVIRSTGFSCMWPCMVRAPMLACNACRHRTPAPQRTHRCDVTEEVPPGERAAACAP